MFQFPGQSIIQAELLVNYGTIVQVVVGFVTAPIFGYLANYIESRKLVSVGLLLGIASHLSFAFAHSVAAIYFSYVCVGLSSGAFHMGVVEFLTVFFRI